MNRNVGNYPKELKSKFYLEEMVKNLEYKLSKTDEPKLKNAIKAKLKALKGGDKTVEK